MVATLSEVETETLNDTPVEAKAEPLFNALSNMLAEVEAETQIDRVADVKAESTVDVLAYTLADVES